MAPQFQNTITMNVPPPKTTHVVDAGGIKRLPGYLVETGLIGVDDNGRIKIGAQVIIVTDRNVNRLHGATVVHSLALAGIKATTIVIQPGEKRKNLRQLERVWRKLNDAGAHRDSVIIALGGGVVTDLVGFAAATFLRGVKGLVNIPTTLLGMVDAGIGGKTAVDTEWRKNGLGATYPARLVLSDPDFLRTLSPRLFREGFGEVIKTAFLCPDILPLLDEYVRLLAQGADILVDPFTQILAKCVEYKSGIVELDPLERDGLRELLNFGHTLAHAIEKAENYRGLLHGEAVAVGMVLAVLLSRRLNFLPDGAMLRRLTVLLAAFELPCEYHIPQDFFGRRKRRALMAAMLRDKKNRGGGPRFVLTRGPGKMEGRWVDPVDVNAVLEPFLSATP